jgi:hypothetical protein
VPAGWRVQGRLLAAAQHYAAALQLFPPLSTEAVACHSNRAQCFLSHGSQLDAALEVRSLCLSLSLSLYAAALQLFPPLSTEALACLSNRAQLGGDEREVVGS